MATLLHRAPNRLHAPTFETQRAPVQRNSEHSARIPTLITLVLIVLALGYAATRLSFDTLLVAGAVTTAMLAMLIAFGLWVQENTL